MLKNKLIVTVLTIALLLAFAGCKQDPTQAQGGIGSTIRSIIQGDVSGELNKSYSTKWFDFTVKSIKTAYEYGEYEVIEGYKFVIVAVSETNTFDEPIPMSSYDFEIDADGLLDEDRYPCEAFEDSMMPEEFELAVGETCEYDVVFLIPDDTVDVRIIYIEVDEGNNIGATFTIHHSL